MAGRTFGSILQGLRRERGLTQEELAFRCSLDRTYISLLERGLRTPTITTLFRLSSVLEVKAEDFIAQIEVRE